MVGRWSTLLAACIPLLLAHAACAQSQEGRWYERFIDPADGQFDLSDHLLKHRGLLPVPIIITEPALGYGGGLAALWFKESLEEAGARSLEESGQRGPPAERERQVGDRRALADRHEPRDAMRRLL